MSSYRLRKGLSFCRIGDAIIFLDVERDKYHRLGSALVAPLNDIIAGAEVSPSDIARLEKVSILERCDENDSVRPAPTFLEPATAQHVAVSRGSFRAWPTAKAVWAVQRQRAILRHSGFAALLRNLQPIASPARRKTGSENVDRLLRAFEHVRCWQASSDLCLPRSFALANLLRARGFAAQVVLAVRIDPFHAHCWAQAGEHILNDSAEEVAKFTPILVL